MFFPQFEINSETSRIDYCILILFYWGFLIEFNLVHTFARLLIRIWGYKWGESCDLSFPKLWNTAPCPPQAIFEVKFFLNFPRKIRNFNHTFEANLSWIHRITSPKPSTVKIHSSRHPKQTQLKFSPTFPSSLSTENQKNDFYLQFQLSGTYPFLLVLSRSARFLSDVHFKLHLIISIRFHILIFFFVKMCYKHVVLWVA